MMLNHIGFPERGKNLEMALDVCGQYEKRLVITGRPNGATGTAFTDYLMETLHDPKLKEKWEGFVKK
jgi:hypothetical protein